MVNVVSSKCWDIKQCPFRGTNPEKSKCGAYKTQVGCWEYDWVGFYNEMPDCAGKIEWRNTMLDGCPRCEVYSLHKKEMDSVLEGLRKAGPGELGNELTQNSREYEPERSG